MSCIYSHEDGAYCDKHSHGAVTLSCYGEEDCPDRIVQTNSDRVNHPMWSDTDTCTAWLKSPVEVDNGT